MKMLEKYNKIIVKINVFNFLGIVFFSNATRFKEKTI